MLLQLDGEEVPSGEPSARSIYERWILGLLDRVTGEAHAHLSAYRFDLFAQSLYAFVWDEYCDWFLELAKPVLQEGDASERASMRHTLAFVLERTLRLLHPLIPFITEELWQQLAPRLGLRAVTIGAMSYPQPAGRSEAEAEEAMRLLKGLVVAVRRLRSEYGVPPTRQVEVLAATANPALPDFVAAHHRAIASLARLSAWRWLVEDEEPRVAAVAIEGDCRIFLPLAGLIDLDAERERLERELARLQREIERSEGKLARSDFRERAPAAVVAQEEARLAEFRDRLAALRERRARLQERRPSPSPVAPA